MGEIAPGLWHWTARHPHLMDDPDETKQRLREADRAVLDLDLQIELLLRG